MSLARAALHARPRLANSTLLLQCRLASSAASHEECHGVHHDPDGTQYPNEGGFFTPFWRNTVILSMLVASFYRFAPAPGEEIYLTQYLKQFKPSREAWASLNAKHLFNVTTEGEGQVLQASAQRPTTYRYRYPQKFDFVSPHLSPVGSEIDMSSVVAKGSHE